MQQTGYSQKVPLVLVRLGGWLILDATGRHASLPPRFILRCAAAIRRFRWFLPFPAERVLWRRGRNSKG